MTVTVTLHGATQTKSRERFNTGVCHGDVTQRYTNQITRTVQHRCLSRWRYTALHKPNHENGSTPVSVTVTLHGATQTKSRERFNTGVCHGDVTQRYTNQITRTVQHRCLSRWRYTALRKPNHANGSIPVSVTVTLHGATQTKSRERFNTDDCHGDVTRSYTNQITRTVQHRCLSRWRYTALHKQNHANGSTPMTVTVTLHGATQTKSRERFNTGVCHGDVTRSYTNQITRTVQHRCLSRWRYTALHKPNHANGSTPVTVTVTLHGATQTKSRERFNTGDCHCDVTRSYTNQITRTVQHRWLSRWLTRRYTNQITRTVQHRCLSRWRYTELHKPNHANGSTPVTVTVTNTALHKPNHANGSTPVTVTVTNTALHKPNHANGSTPVSVTVTLHGATQTKSRERFNTGVCHDDVTRSYTNQITRTVQHRCLSRWRYTALHKPNHENGSTPVSVTVTLHGATQTKSRERFNTGVCHGDVTRRYTNKITRTVQHRWLSRWRYTELHKPNHANGSTPVSVTVTLHGATQTKSRERFNTGVCHGDVTRRYTNQITRTVQHRWLSRWRYTELHKPNHANGSTPVSVTVTLHGATQTKSRERFNTGDCHGDVTRSYTNQITRTVQHRCLSRWRYAALTKQITRKVQHRWLSRWRYTALHKPNHENGSTPLFVTVTLHGATQTKSRERFNTGVCHGDVTRSYTKQITRKVQHRWLSRWRYTELHKPNHENGSTLVSVTVTLHGATQTKSRERFNTAVCHDDVTPRYTNQITRTVQHRCLSRWRYTAQHKTNHENGSTPVCKVANEPLRSVQYWNKSVCLGNVTKMSLKQTSWYPSLWKPYHNRLWKLYGKRLRGLPKDRYQKIDTPLNLA